MNSLGLNDILLIHSGTSDYTTKEDEHDEIPFSSINKSSNPWFLQTKILENLLSISNSINPSIDLCLVDVAWGILVVKRRDREGSGEGIYFHDVSSSNSKKLCPVNIDQFLPVLSVHELIDWVSI